MARRRKVAVRVVRRADKDKLVLRWTDPTTGKTRERTTDTTKRREALRQAAEIALQVEDGQRLDEIGWKAFRNRYEDEKLVLQRPKSMAAFRTAANILDELMAPKYLDDVDASLLSRLAARLREKDLTNATIASYLREIRVAMNWAARVFPGFRPPEFRLPKTPKSKIMKGRPITGEEFDRMLTATPDVVGKRHAESWRFFLRGLWLSGLRLEEALTLDWEREDVIHVHGIDKRRPMLRIHAAGEKGNQDRLLPITPDFVEFLREVPDDHRHGPVFRPQRRNGLIKTSSTASRTISDIGEKASVVVDRKYRKGKDGTLTEVVKYASAHDLRRSFGERWAPRVMPVILKELMRHESIETTMKYYVGQNAERTAAEVWRAFGDLTGDPQKPTQVDQDATQPRKS
jgi:integrase